MTELISLITYRTRAMLRAVAAGRADVTSSSEPDLFVDGSACCDQMAAHALVRSPMASAEGRISSAFIPDRGADLVGRSRVRPANSFHVHYPSWSRRRVR